MSKTRWIIGAGATFALGLAACASDTEVAIEGYPTDRITLVVPVPAGSSTDLSARVLAPCLEEELDTNIVVENRDGGSGAVGNTFFTQSAPDGYTLVMSTAANVVLPPLLEDSVTFTPDDFRPVGTVGQAPILMIAADGERSAEDVLETAESERLLVGVPGATSVPAIVTQGLIEEHGLNIEIVPFDGNGNTLQALRAGDVDVILVSADSGATLPALDDGDVEALATAVTENIPHLPEVPTLDSLGYGDLPYADSFWFVAAQAETPDEIVGVLETAMEACMTDSHMQEQLGEGVAPPEFLDAARTEAMLREAAETYADYADN